MRIHVNQLCNVVSREQSRNGHVMVTVPRHRLVMFPEEARRLAAALLEAAEVAEAHAAEAGQGEVARG